MPQLRSLAAFYNIGHASSSHSRVTSLCCPYGTSLCKSAFFQRSLGKTAFHESCSENCSHLSGLSFNSCLVRPVRPLVSPGLLLPVSKTGKLIGRKNKCGSCSMQYPGVLLGCGVPTERVFFFFIWKDKSECGYSTMTRNTGFCVLFLLAVTKNFWQFCNLLLVRFRELCNYVNILLR